MKNNSLEINGYTFTGERISSASAVLETSISKEFLPVDSLSVQIKYSGNYELISSDDLMLISSDDLRLFASDSDYDIDGFDIAQCKRGDEIFYYYDSSLFGKFYFEKYKRVPPDGYAISCFSALGLLDNAKHYGGIYTGQTTANVIADIIAGQIQYTISDKIAENPIYGWLPANTRRKNLHQLLLAQGISIMRNSDGNTHFFRLAKSAQKEIPGDRVFSGNRNIDYLSHATLALVTEHSYIPYADDKQSVLFEGTVRGDIIISPKGKTLTGAIIEFSAPMHDLLSDGSAILESGVNYAVLAPGASKLSGKEYTHTQRVVQYPPPQLREYIQLSENKAEISGNTLINSTNSDSAAERLMAYYGAVDIASQDIVMETERPCDFVAFTDAFGQPSEGFIESIQIAMSNIMRGSTKIAKNYTPPIVVNYTHYAIITSSQTFTVPDEAVKIGVILIGGAQGGRCGNAGGNSSSISVSFTGGLSPAQWTGYGLGSGGSGGSGGLGGKGGKVLQTSMRVTAGQKLSISIGRGGSGAAYSSSDPDGSLGSPTVLEQLSSDMGSYFDRGYLEPFTNEIYGSSGSRGISGGKGSSGAAASSSVTMNNLLDFTSGNTIWDEDNVMWNCGTTLSTVTSGRVDSKAQSVNGDGNLDHGYASAASSAGLGGGAAAGSHGIDSTTVGAVNVYKNGSTLYAYSYGYKGTSGATATKIPRKASKGNGGRGGYGGGGAGAPGVSVIAKKTGSAVSSISATAYKPADGVGGNGGQGGEGSDGVAIIYW